MSRFVRGLALATLVALCVPAGLAQYPSEVLGFNGPGYDDPASHRDTFQIPEFNSTSKTYILPNAANSYANNAAYRAADLMTEGAAAEYVYWSWADVNNTNAWVRLTTFNAPIKPNPALHTQGKVRFKLANRSEIFAGLIGVCIGVRETGVDVAQMLNGGVNGPIEWAGVSNIANGIIVGADYTVNTVAAGDDVQVYPLGTQLDPNDPNSVGIAVITPGSNGTLETTPAGDDVIRRGWFQDTTRGTRVPIPVAVLDPLSGPYALEFNLANGEVRIEDLSTSDVTVIPAAIAPYAGPVETPANGQFDITPYRGALEHIAITKIAGDTATRIEFGIDELQFEAPVPDPVSPPTVVAPLIKGQTTIVVDGIKPPTDSVELYLDGALLSTAATADPNADPNVVFTVAALQTGQKYKARQHDTLTNQWSAFSTEVTVLPAASPFTLSVVVDENGDNCTYTDGGAWEYIPCYGKNTSAPIGVNLFPNSAIWQTVDISLASDPVLNWLSGNNQMTVSPSGVYSIDSLWFSQTAGNPVGGPREVLIDSVQALDAMGNVLVTMENMEDGFNYYAQVRGQSVDALTATGLITTGSYDGGSAQRLQWTFGTLGLERTLAVYHAKGGACNSTATFPDISATATLRYHMVIREIPPTGGVALPVVAGPIIVGNQTSVRVTGIDATATAVELFINGDSAGAPVNPAGATQVDFNGLTLAPGDSVAAKQTVGGILSDFSYPRGVSAAPLPPKVSAPILPGATQVTVTGLLTAPFTQVSLVTVYVNGVSRGTAVPAAGAASVAVTISPAVAPFDVVTAAQTVNTVLSGLSAPVTVSVPAPTITVAPASGDVLVKVQDLNTSATQVVLSVNDVDQTPFNLTPGFTQPVSVPVPILASGQQVKAKQLVGGTFSGYSTAEVVTIGTATTVFSDNMESYVDQADFENAAAEVRDRGWWGASGDPVFTLTTASNATPGGSKSVYCPTGQSPPAAGWGDGYQCNFDFKYPEPDWTPVAGTDTEPIVWNFNMYDAGGPGFVNVRQWCELRDYSTGSLRAIVAIGMPGASFFGAENTNYYAARIYGGTAVGYVNLDHPGAPQRTIGWHNFTAIIKNASIDFYVDGVLAKKGIYRRTDVYDNLYMGSGYEALAEAWYDDFTVEKGKPRFLTIAPQPPTAPAIGAPVMAGDMEVTVKNVAPSATRVDVYADAALVGQLTLTPPNAVTQVVAPLTTPLVHLQSITAKQVNPAGASVASPAIEVGKKNGVVTIALGIRETGDTGPLGSPGSTATAPIEWIGATAANAGAPVGKSLTPMNAWQTVTFAAADGVLSFSGGNGVIDGTRGTIDHLAVAVDPASPNRSSGIYRMYVDNVVNVGAGAGGADFVIANFDAFTLGQSALFQYPTYSGTTSGNFLTPPSTSVVSSVYGNPSQAQELKWFFKSTAAGRWARIVTSGAQNTPSPIIDLTKPIRMDILLPIECTFKGDNDASGSVAFPDFQAFKNCLLGPGVATDPACNCFDFNDDGRIDLFDFAEFQAVYMP